MRFPIDVEQLRGVHVGVALSGRQLHVPEQLLDGAQIGTRSRRCVAKECRSACGLMPNRVLHAAT